MKPRRAIEPDILIKSKPLTKAEELALSVFISAYKKTHKSINELDVDFIGGQEPLAKEEETAISKFIKAKELKHEE